MVVALKPGNMNMGPAKPPVDDLADSIAEAIDFEYDRLLRAADLQGLTFDMTDSAVRDRRRFLVAIARGLVIHLTQHSTAFTVTVPDIALPVTLGASVATDGV